MLVILIVLLIIFSYTLIKVYYAPSQPSENKPKLRIGLDKNIPPYAYYNEKGNLVGFHIDLLNAMEKYTPYSFVYVPMNWDRVIDSLETGYVDAIIGVVPTPQRNRTLSFTEPYTTLNFILFKNKNAPNVGSIGELEGHKVAVIKEDITEIKLKEYMNETGIEINLIEVDTTQQGLIYLNDGYAEYFIYEEKTGIFVISSLHLQNVIPTSVRFFSLPICMAVRKGDTKLLNILNTALAKVKESGEYSEIYSKWLISEQKPRGFNYAWIAVGIILALTLVLGVEYIRTWKRERNVARRAMNLMQLSRLLLEKMPVGIMYIVEGKCYYINPEGSKILGYSIKEINDLGITDILMGGEEISIVAKDGKEKWLLVRKIRYRNGYILSFIDVTSLKVMERRDKRRFEEINEMLDSLRNPVQNLLFASENIEREDMQKIIKDNVEKIAEILKKDIE